MKTSELTGAALDWAVEKIEGTGLGYFSPSTNWAHGGPIMEREEIGLTLDFGMSHIGWTATRYEGGDIVEEQGRTQLIAAMRCYVASVLGDEVEIPKELTTP